jgi:hypothetical protein
VTPNLRLGRTDPEYQLCGAVLDYRFYYALGLLRVILKTDWRDHKYNLFRMQSAFLCDGLKSLPYSFRRTKRE